MNSKSRGDWVVFGVLALVAGVLWVTQPQIIFLEQLFTVIERPFFALRASLIAWPRSLSANQAEIDQLKEQNRLLALDQNELAVCREENQKMSQLLGSPLPVKANFILAHVLGLADTLKIDRGENDGVKVGQVVLADNILIGRILRVNATTSLVQLLSDPSLKISVITQKDGQTKAKGLLSRLILDQVLQEEKLDKSDLVITTSAGGWPPNLLIGTINDVLANNRGLFRQAKVQPLVDPQNLEIVFVVNQ